jgi:hypothetical protein
MRTQLEHSKLTDEDRLHFHFAAGKALEDAGDYAASFEHYARANELRRKGIPYDAAEVSAQVQRTKDTLTRPFLAERTGWGAAAPDPIFIIGLPRSGSTLLEQVLSSHSAVEGTMELPDLISIVKELGGRRKRSETSKYPEVLTRLGADELREIGERYWNGRACTARRMRRASSTRCRTISRTLASSISRFRTQRSSTRGAIPSPAASRTSSSTSPAGSTSATASRTSAATIATTSS